jgi:hypothetical protein
MRLMRDTSVRRRAPRPRVYRGSPGKKPNTPPGSDITVPDDDVNGVVCGQCGARVKALVSGRPRAHAPGGMSTNTRLGRYKCEGSGNDGRET